MLPARSRHHDMRCNCSCGKEELKGRNMHGSAPRTLLLGGSLAPEPLIVQLSLAARQQGMLRQGGCARNFQPLQPSCPLSQPTSVLWAAVDLSVAAPTIGINRLLKKR